MRTQPKAERSSAMPWVRAFEKWPRPERAQKSVPHISFIEFNFVSFEKSPEFVLKRNLFMMIALMADVISHLFNRGLAHRKGAVAALPIKIVESLIAFAQPIVGTFFQLPNDIADRVGACHHKQQMRVVRFGIDFNWLTSEPVENSSHVGVQSRSNFIRKISFPIFCGKNQMDVDFGERLRHVMILALFQSAR